MKRQLFHRSENSAKTTDIPLSGSAAKKPRLTTNWKTITCRINNHVPLVVPGLSTNSGSRASSTSPLRDQFSTDVSEEQREVAASKNGSGQSTKCENQMKIRNAGVMRMIKCKVFLSGWSRSQTILRIQKTMHPHKFLYSWWSFASASSGSE